MKQIIFINVTYFVIFRICKERNKRFFFSLFQWDCFLNILKMERIEIEESSWPSMYWKFEVGSSLARGQPRNISTEVVRQDLEKWKVNINHVFLTTSATFCFFIVVRFFKFLNLLLFFEGGREREQFELIF